MDIIDSFYANMNIYYSLVLAGGTDAAEAARTLAVFDYPAVLVDNVADVERLEQNYRIFVMPAGLLAELLFVKGTIKQYNVLFCLDQEAFEVAGRVLAEKRPDCVENVYVTKISLDII